MEGKTGGLGERRRKVCLFSLNIPLQILPAARSVSLWVWSLPQPRVLHGWLWTARSPLPSPSYCRHTLYQSITDTVNTCVSQYYLVIPQYYDIYLIIFMKYFQCLSGWSRISLVITLRATPTLLPVYHIKRCVPVLKLGLSSEHCQHLKEKISWGEVKQDMSS